MRVINSEQLKSILAGLPSNPRIIASGNFSSPRTLLKVADEVQNDQAINIIHNAAHPSVREELISKAGECGLL